MCKHFCLDDSISDMPLIIVNVFFRRGIYIDTHIYIYAHMMH